MSAETLAILSTCAVCWGAALFVASAGMKPGRDSRLAVWLMVAAILIALAGVVGFIILVGMWALVSISGFAFIVSALNYGGEFF